MAGLLAAHLRAREVLPPPPLLPVTHISSISNVNALALTELA